MIEITTGTYLGNWTNVLTRLEVHVAKESTITCRELAELSCNGTAIITLLEDDSVIIAESDESLKTRIRKKLKKKLKDGQAERERIAKIPQELSGIMNISNTNQEK